jgi:hypothetical protein
MTNVKPPARIEIPATLQELSKTVDGVMPDWKHVVWSEKNLPKLDGNIAKIVYGDYSQIVISNILRFI